MSTPAQSSYLTDHLPEVDWILVKLWVHHALSLLQEQIRGDNGKIGNVCIDAQGKRRRISSAGLWEF